MKNAVIIVLAVLVLAMGGYLVYDKIIDKDDKKQENNIEDNKNIEEKIVLSKLEQYKSDTIDKINVNIIDSVSGKYKNEIIAYKDNKEVWKYTTDEYEIPQREPFKIIVIMGEKLYIQFMGDIFILNIENGKLISKVENIGWDCKYIYINDEYIYITSVNGGSPFDIPYYLTIISIKTNEQVNRIKLYEQDDIYLIEKINNYEIVFAKTIFNSDLGEFTELYSKSVKTDELLNKSFNLKSIFE